LPKVSGINNINNGSKRKATYGQIKKSEVWIPNSGVALDSIWRCAVVRVLMTQHHTLAN
jgi:hypothetical protein